MKTPSYEDKQKSAFSQSERVKKVNSDHPKHWDKYIADRQKQVKTQTRGHSHASK